MGGRCRRRKSKAALVSGLQPEDNTGSHYPGKDIDPPAAAAAPATGCRPEEDLGPASAEDWWATHNFHEFPNGYSTQIKSDPRFNAGRHKHPEWPATERSKFNALLDQLEVVENEILEIEKERVKIKSEIDRLERIPDTSLDEHIIIAFVKEMEREIEYPKFEDYLKRRVDIQHDSDDLETFKVLVQKEKSVRKRYKKLDFKDIMHAIRVRIRDLRIERDRKLKSWKENISTSSEEDEKEFCQLSDEDSDEDLSSNPIGDLVKSIGQKGYCLHWDPLNELKFIEIHNPDFYCNYFLRKVLMKYSKTRVMVTNVPCGYHEKDVEDLLSVCGKIAHVKVDQLESSTKIAYVTFYDPGAAKIASILMERTHISILPIFEPCELTVNEETQREFEKALMKYDDFRRSIFN